MNKNGHAFISAAQIRAARGLIGWSQEDLAEASNLSIATIRKLEIGYISPRYSTTQFIRQALEASGLEFVEPDGVRRRPEDIAIYQGRDGYVKFFEDVCHTASSKGGEVIAVYSSEVTIGYLGLEEYQRSYAERMLAIRNKAKVKIILTENQTPNWAPYIEYRLLSKYYVDSVPFYVYGDKYAIFMFDVEPTPKIVVLQSHAVAEAFRHQFYSMWEKATPIASQKVPGFEWAERTAC